jgi:hypothetical protein
MLERVCATREHAKLAAFDAMIVAKAACANNTRPPVFSTQTITEGSKSE